MADSWTWLAYWVNMPIGALGNYLLGSMKRIVDLESNSESVIWVSPSQCINFYYEEDFPLNVRVQVRSDRGKHSCSEI